MKVVFAGIGLLTTLGPDREYSWRALLDSSDSNLLTAEPNPDRQLAAAGNQAVGFGLAPGWLTAVPGRTRLEQMALQTAAEALQDAGLTDSSLLHSPRFGCVVGTSKGPLEQYHPPTAADRTPFAFSQLWPSSPSVCLIEQYGLTGPAVCPVSACATGLDAVLRAVRLIEQGDCDVVLAGSVDASLNEYLTHSYRRLGVLANRTSPMQQACKPFDAHRSGFVLGEGAAMFVLARSDLPELADRPHYGRWLAGASVCDATSLTQLDPTGTTLIDLLSELLSSTTLHRDQIDLCQLHGTGTQTNDCVEAAAIRQIFGPPDRQPFCTATKGAHGHTLGAAGSIELAWLLLSLRDQLIPPIRNLAQLDPTCPIRPVIGEPLAMQFKHGLKTSLGFGGHQIACVIERGTRQRSW